MKPNILMISLTPLRVNHLSCYGYHRDTTSNIDRLAAEGTIFEKAYSTANWTPPAHASLVTGLFPSCHGVLGHEGLGLRDSVPTMASLLSGLGYHTVGFVTSSYVGEDARLDRGFQEFQRTTRGASSNLWGRTFKIRRKLGLVGIRRKIRRMTGRLVNDKGTKYTTRHAVKWLDAYGQREQPFFMLLHYHQMHYPYIPPPAYKYRYTSRTIPGVDWSKIQRINKNVLSYLTCLEEATPRELEVLKAFYDAQIYYVDECLGQLFAYMRQSRILDQTLVIVLSAHGVNIGEYNLGAPPLYERIIHIPLIFRHPEIAPAGLRVQSLVQLTDILPTLLELVGHRADELQLQGNSLLPIRPNRRYREYVIAEAGTPALYKLMQDAGQQEDLERFARTFRMIRQGDHKYIGGSDGSEALFNLATDPGELHNLVTQEPRRTQVMAAQLNDLLGSFKHQTGAPETDKIKSDILKELRSLGYRI